MAPPHFLTTVLPTATCDHLSAHPLLTCLPAVLPCFLACLAPGAYEEVAEGDFLAVVTQSERVVCHFFHHEFERCRIMDKHLGALARKHFDTRFIKLSAPVSGVIAFGYRFHLQLT